MQFSAVQLAQLINGTIEGNESASVSSFGKIEEAKEGQISFLANPKYEDYLYESKATIVIVNKSLQLKKTVTATLIRVDDAYSAFATLLGFYEKMITPNYNGIEQPSFIDTTATVGSDVYIGAFAYIGKNAIIKDGVKIFPHCYIGDNVVIDVNSKINSGVKIYHNCKVGSNVIIHAGTVIGSDGFGFAPQADGSLQKVPQLGNVVIENNVEIGANTVIDRATIGSTIIKANAKLDNLIQVAHNVEIGNTTVIAAQTGISGSTKIGNGVMIGGQAGIAGHLQIGDLVKINGQSGVGKSLKSGVSVTGTPAGDFAATMRIQASTRKIPDLEARIKAIEQAIKNSN
jgi:UDP-3-O-[3-hydroxymyristoyl] glucosamine N-acyltransferase